MITTKAELKYYLAADRMMNRGSFRRSVRTALKEMFIPDWIMQYLIVLRKTEYAVSRHSNTQFYWKM